MGNSSSKKHSLSLSKNSNDVSNEEKRKDRKENDSGSGAGPVNLIVDELAVDTNPNNNILTNSEDSSPSSPMESILLRPNGNNDSHNNATETNDSNGQMPTPGQNNAFTLVTGNDYVKSLEVDDMIQRLIVAGYSNKVSKSVPLKSAEIHAICQAARDIFLSQPALIELSPPVKIVGDVHGQYSDLIRLFDMCGFPPAANYLFLGDYVDRGKQSLETILLLLCYKIKYPENFFLLRGNHECANVTRVYGFYDECKRRLSLKIWKAFIDPSETAVDWEDNERGVSYCFGKAIISEFLQRHDFDLVCRAHMVVEDGYEFFDDRKLVTVFSAPNYCGEFDNFGAVMSVNEELLCSFELLKPLDASVKIQQQIKQRRRPSGLLGPYSPPTVGMTQTV
ncbi:unnamed protein product [Rhizophagus irregularis]|uniref:Serine/threonine-protein phosphatase n=1 Tax=Rhizophagus irregularis TaxID=588596 RepID=A0A915Z437_9GLOM|nr:unnamed protein product [Rhizophagus irregularis]